MKLIAGKTIKNCSLVDPGAVLSDVEYENCVFENSSVSVRHNWPSIESRICIQDTVFRRCETNGSRLGLDGIALEDVELDSFASSIHASYCSFSRVRLVGRFRGLRVDRYEPDLSDPNYSYWHNLNLANERIAQATDWALDVSEAEFDSASMILGVPAHLIRIDPSRQATVTPLSVQGADAFFSEADLLSEVGVGISRAMGGWEDSSLIMVSFNSKDSARELELVRRIHECGLAASGGAGE